MRFFHIPTKSLIKYHKSMKLQKIFVVTLLTMVSLCACGKQPEPENKENATVDFHTELQSNYLNDFFEDVNLYADGTKELSKPKGYTIEYSNPNNLLYKIELQSDIDNRSFTARDESYTFTNLYLNTKYHYVVSSNSNIIVENDFYTTNLAPRNIDVEGVTNFRDLGGHLTNDGKYTKQGMIYRSARFSENGTKNSLITAKGKRTAVNELHIKSEIDLRLTSNNETGGLTKSVIDDSVQYFNVPMTFDGDVISLNENEIRHLFDIISVKSNYPFVFHCSIGTDRTGYVAFLLNSLLEVKQEEIYRDYLFSNFGLIGGSRNAYAISSYIGYFSIFEGETLKEQVNNYLLSIGVAQTKIDSFISIMN